MKGGVYIPPAKKPKKIPKTTKPAKIKSEIPIESYKCATCGRIYPQLKKNFRPSKSPLYVGNEGYIPTCMICLDKLYKHYEDMFGDEKEAMKRMCMHFDIYYNEDLFQAAKKGKGTEETFGSYFSKLNLHQYGGGNKTYDDSLDEEINCTIESIEDVKENKDINISRKSIKFWGVGYEPDEYRWLDDEYSSWVIRANNGENPSKALENTLKEMCATQIDIKRARKAGAKGSDISTLQNTYLKLMEGAGLKPSQEDTSSVAEKNALGVLIDVWEETEPVPKYPDENKIIKYISVWFKGHLAKAANLTNDTKEEYNSEIEKYKVKILEDAPTVVSEGESDG